nr:transposase (putative), gypsy type [Tanacetum cinerariifolium]
MGRDTVQLETAVNTISQEYLLEFTSEYDIPKALHPELPRPEDRIVDFPEGNVGVYTKFFEFANFRLPLSQFLFDILGYYQIYLSQLSFIGAAKQEVGEEYLAVLYQALGLSQKLEQPLFLGGREGVPDCRGLANECSKRWDAGREHIFRRSRENTGCTPHSHLKTTRGATLLSGNKPQILPGGRDMDVFSLIRAPNPTKVKTESRPRAANDVPLLTVTATRVIEMKDPAAATDSSSVPSTIERSPLDFATKAGAEGQGTMALEVLPPEDVSTTRGVPEAGQAKRVAATDPPAVGESRKRCHDGVDANAPPKVLRRDHADPRPTGGTHGRKSLAAIELDMGSTRPAHVPENTPADVSLPKALMRQEIRSLRMPPLLSRSGLLRDLVDHVAPPGYFLELRHLRNDDFLRQYNVNLARQVAMGSQLRLRFEQEAKLLKKSVAQVARRDKIIQAREHEIKNLKALLEAEADMKKAAEDKSAKLSKELENIRTLFSDLQRCAKMDARLDALSIDFDEELYPHMLTAIAGRRWMIGHGLRLAVVKCSESLELRQAFADVVSAGIAKGMIEGLRHGVEHGHAQLNLEAIEVYDPEGEAKYIAALQALKNLKYPLVDQLEGLKDAPMDVIMASMHLESDNGDDAPQWVRELRPSSSQLTIPVYPEKKKKCRIVCRTHGVSSEHHARSDGVPVSAPTVIPQGLAILLADAATQTESDDATLNNL